MKFGKLLKSCSEDMPGMDNLFVRYKQLKKQLKAIPVSKDSQDASNSTAGPSGSALAPGGALSPEEIEFVRTLNEDVQRCNQYFMEKEEDAVIKLHSLVDQVENLTSEEQTQQTRAELVDFHGEVVLLLHWSLLNYAAVVKILKKHDKRTGLLLRAPYLSNVLQQPFYSTSVMSRLVKKAEELVRSLVKGEQEEHSAAAQDSAVDSGASCSVSLCRRTKNALETWQTLKDTAHTPSTVLSVEDDGVTQAVKDLTSNLIAIDKLAHTLHGGVKGTETVGSDQPQGSKRPAADEPAENNPSSGGGDADPPGSGEGSSKKLRAS